MPAATTERMHVIGLLARCPDGCSIEALILAHGFTIPFLAGLVSARLVTVESSTAHNVRVRITDLALGQQAAM
jgi:hypothetical protein